MKLGSELLHSKKTLAGLEKRLELLEIHFPNVRKWYADVMYTLRGSGACADDVLDSLSLGISSAELPGPLTPIPEISENDSMGLPMMIWFPGR